ncbi:hypothetical protein A6E21_25905 [Bacillus cereus]|nr:hypothetical protein A6E21_25905 [Bacillus cereus]
MGRMREIKFRGWYGENIGMLEPTFNGNINEIFNQEDVVYMQYTGLTDKDGKEIYEGDIVKISGHPFQGSIDIDGNYEVGYNELMELCCGGWYLHRMRHWAEVIGNKFENPELLKGAGENE